MIYYYDISCQGFSIVNLPNYLPGCHSENLGALQDNKKAMLFNFMKNTAFYLLHPGHRNAVGK